jgi:hypothetical protein
MTPDFTLFAGLAGLAAVWSQIRGLFDRLRALVITRATLHGEIATLVSNYLYAHARVLNWGDRYIRSSSTWVRPLDRVAEVAYEHASMQPLIAWLNRRPLMFHCPQQSFSGGHSALPENTNVLILTGLRGSLDITDLTRAALDDARQRQSNGRRYFVRRISGKRESHHEKHGGANASLAAPSSCEEIKPGLRFLHWQESDIGAPQPEHPFAALALCSQGSAARDDFLRWLSLKQWYQQRGIPWRRGHLYYGPPGTGKTSLARALAQQADMPVFAYDISTLDNEQFSEAWQNMQEHTPCMALIEDIDGTFRGRANVRTGEHRAVLTFDCLLNALGGIQTCDGVFIVITTNAPESLDDALGKPNFTGAGTTRPGRLDAAYCLELPQGPQRAKILERICGTSCKDMLLDTHGMTAAQVTEFAISHALAETWSATPPNPSTSSADPAA